MKERLFIAISILIAEVTLLVGFISLSRTIQSGLTPTSPQIPSIVESIPECTTNYLSLLELARYLRMDEFLIEQLVSNGEFDGTYVAHTINNVTTYTFSRVKIDEWMEYNIELVKTLN